MVLEQNFGKYKDEQGKYGRSQCKILTTEQDFALYTHTGCTHGVSNGIERKNGRNGFVNVLLILFEQSGTWRPSRSSIDTNDMGEESKTASSTEQVNETPNAVKKKYE